MKKKKKFGHLLESIFEVVEMLVIRLKKTRQVKGNNPNFPCPDFFNLITLGSSL
jgi:hypothetical protein